MDNRTFNEIRNDIATAINQIRDPQSNQNFNVDYNNESDILGVFVNTIALHILDLNEQLTLLRSMLNPFKAVGQGLRDVMTYRGLLPKKATSTTATAKFRGTNGTIIPEGSTLKNLDESIVFLTRNAAQIADGSATVEIYSQNTGVVVITGVDLFLNPPIEGINLITIDNIVLGTDDETDQQIHMRMENGAGALGRGILDIIDAALMDIDGVTSATSYFGGVHDIPAGSMCSVVVGGDNQNIAKTIFEKNIFVKNTFGNTSVVVASAYLNRQYEINFMRPEVINSMELTLTLNKINSDDYAKNLKETIANAINAYFVALLPGATVYATDICSVVNALNLCKVESYEMKSDARAQASDKILLAWNQTPLLDINKLTLNLN